jgi:glycosyltransferase involved in cell wall biosynthesis
MMPSISVIVPVYNRFHSLKRTVESVLAQTLRVLEVIVIDDGSVDQTPRLLPQYIRDNPVWRGTVRYLRQENQGPNVARNHGIAHANGEWLAFSDDDDLWLPKKLEWQFRALDKFGSRCGACITDAWFMNNASMKMTLFQLAGRRHVDPIGLIPDPPMYVLDKDPLLGLHPVWLQNLITRTDLARRIGGFDLRLRFGDDDDFAFRLACETGFCYVSMPLVLIDRTPPAERHIGASIDWDKEDFRLLMAQLRYEKRLGTIQKLSPKAQSRIRKDLAAVHSGWANWFLQKGDLKNARAAISKAARFALTPNIAIKWALLTSSPGLARRTVLEVRRRKSLRIEGLG